jgi:uncharacterized protein
MKMALDAPSGSLAVQSYVAGCVTVGNRQYRSSLVLTATGIVSDWSPRAADALRAGDLSVVLDDAPEVLLLGTGEQQVFPDPAVFATLMDLGIGFEVMDNAAACRTYNVLLSEYRKVALALLMDAG